MDTRQRHRNPYVLAYRQVTNADWTESHGPTSQTVLKTSILACESICDEETTGCSEADRGSAVMIKQVGILLLSLRANSV